MLGQRIADRNWINLIWWYPEQSSPHLSLAISSLSASFWMKRPLRAWWGSWMQMQNLFECHVGTISLRLFEENMKQCMGSSWRWNIVWRIFSLKSSSFTIPHSHFSTIFLQPHLTLSFCFIWFSIKLNQIWLSGYLKDLCLPFSDCHSVRSLGMKISQNILLPIATKSVQSLSALCSLVSHKGQSGLLCWFHLSRLHFWEDHEILSLVIHYFLMSSIFVKILWGNNY